MGPWRPLQIPPLQIPPPPPPGRPPAPGIFSKTPTAPQEKGGAGARGGVGGEGAPRPHLRRKRAPFSAKTPLGGRYFFAPDLFALKHTQTRAWPRYCRKVCWTKMVQNGPNDHFGQNDLIPDWILAFARPKWTKMVHFGLRRSILVHLGPPTVLWPFLTNPTSRGMWAR